MAAHVYLAPELADEELSANAGVPIRVVLGTSHALMRRGLRQLLEDEQGIEVIADATDLATTAAHVYRDAPRVLVLDLSMSDGSGLDGIGELRQSAPATQIVVLTMNDSAAFAQQALAGGAAGLVLKDHADSELTQAVRAVSAEEEYVSPRVAERLRALRRSLTRGELSVFEAPRPAGRLPPACPVRPS